MSPQELEVLQALRVLLFLGVIFVGAVLFIDLMGQPPADTRAILRSRPTRVVEEECKLHARKLKDCPPGSHDQPEDGSPDDS